MEKGPKPFSEEKAKEIMEAEGLEERSKVEQDAFEAGISSTKQKERDNVELLVEKKIQTVKEYFIHSLSHNFTNDVLEGNFGVEEGYGEDTPTISLPIEEIISIIPPEEIKQAAEKGFISRLRRGDFEDIDTAIKIKDKFHLSDDLITSSEVQRLAEEIFGDCVMSCDIEIVDKIRDKFFLPKTSMQKKIKRAIIANLSNGDFAESVEIKKYATDRELFSSEEIKELVSSSKVKQAAEEGFNKNPRGFYGPTVNWNREELKRGDPEWFKEKQKKLNDFFK